MAHEGCNGCSSSTWASQVLSLLVPKTITQLLKSALCVRHHLILCCIQVRCYMLNPALLIDPG